MREDQFDEDGVRIPFSDFKDYNKLMHLVPDAQCSTRAGKFTRWEDARPKPTYDEIEAVSDEDAELAGKPSSEDLMDGVCEVLEALLDEVPGRRVAILAKMKTKRGK